MNNGTAFTTLNLPMEDNYERCVVYSVTYVEELEATAYRRLRLLKDIYINDDMLPAGEGISRELLVRIAKEINDSQD